jgi:hypothetical protein
MHFSDDWQEECLGLAFEKFNIGPYEQGKAE